MFFDDLESLFRYVLEKDRVVVYGDLGRLPHVVIDYLSTHHSDLKIVFVSPHYPISIPNNVNQFREMKYVTRDAAKSKCDLLVLLEPIDHSTVSSDYPGAGSVVTFTSHAVLDVRDGFDAAIYFHSVAQTTESDRVDRIRRLRNKLEGSEENDDVQIAKNHIDHPSVVTVGPGNHSDVVLSAGKPPPPLNGGDGFFVVVDLTTATLPDSIFLFSLDAFDFMVENLDRVEGWSVCFPLEGTRKYEDFVQECIDRLHCSAIFKPHLRRLLPLLPFYKSGTMETTFEIPVHRYELMEYVAPETLEEAFRTAIAFDTRHLVGGVLSVIK